MDHLHRLVEKIDTSLAIVIGQLVLEEFLHPSYISIMNDQYGAILYLMPHKSLVTMT
jgi:hypothetical protein